MVGCSAIGCSNRGEKGFTMKYFPKDPKRRKEWAAKIKRENWSPSDRSVLCEVHFSADMWEKTRVDGKRKLKANAVPTIFSFVKKVKDRKPPKKRHVAQSMDMKTIEEDPSTSAIATSSPSSTLSMSSESPVLEILRTDLEASAKQKQITQLIAKNNLLKKKLRASQRKVQKLERQIANDKAVEKQKKHFKLLSGVFNADQIYALDHNMKFKKWSNETVKKALLLKFNCGNNGYDQLLQQKIPLPSLRTLTRRLENIKFTSGILNEVFEFLKIKVSSMTHHERDCIIALDEMAITPSLVFDTSLKRYVGHVTLPAHTGIATHALVVMLGGITSRWKQTVAYYYTGDSTNGTVYEEILMEIIAKAESVGLKVVSVTSDMGSSNLVLWKKWNITAGRHSRTKNFIAYPRDNFSKICVLADVPHVFKNMKNMLMSNKVIYISETIQIKYDLPTNEIRAQHILDLIHHQKNLAFLLAPSLTEEDLLPDHFQKMKVKTSTNVVNHAVASGLKFIAEELNKPEYLTTAWYIDLITKWFYYMTSRHPSCALSKLSLESYESAVQFLRDFIGVINELYVGEARTWKPSQAGAIISTASILDIQDYFLNTRSYGFVLTSRFTQDCLENLFSSIRAKQPVPTALQFKNNLRLISVSQFLKDVSKTSYDEDDREYIGDFLEVKKPPPRSTTSFQTISGQDLPELTLNNSEMNSLYSVIGYLISSIKKTTKTCRMCIGSLGSTNYIQSMASMARLTKIKSFKKNALFYCNAETFKFILQVERSFKPNYDNLNNSEIDLKKALVEITEKETSVFELPRCHNLKKKLITRYILFRLKILSKKRIRRKVFSSKTMRP